MPLRRLSRRNVGENIMTVIEGKPKKVRAKQTKDEDVPQKKKGRVSAKLPRTPVPAKQSFPPLHKVVTKIVVDEERFIPQYSTEEAACVDLIANLPDGPVRLPHRAIVRIDCGFSMELPVGWKAEVVPRSGLAERGITVPNSPGQIDSDYRGRVGVIIMNSGKEIIVVNDGDRFAQMWVAPVYLFDFDFGQFASAAKLDALLEQNDGGRE
jgi:dUTP pyrophosphatase